MKSEPSPVSWRNSVAETNFQTKPILGFVIQNERTNEIGATKLQIAIVKEKVNALLEIGYITNFSKMRLNLRELILKYSAILFLGVFKIQLFGRGGGVGLQLRAAAQRDTAD